MSTATEQTLANRYAKYAMKFVNDSGGAMPTDARLAEVLAGCVRPPKPGEYVTIREHIYTYMDGREFKGREVRAALHDRAESYADDARKFDYYQARIYRAIAGELRKVAASL